MFDENVTASFVRSADLATIQMLQSALMSEMRKMPCSTKQSQQRQVWAYFVEKVRFGTQLENFEPLQYHPKISARG